MFGNIFSCEVFAWKLKCTINSTPVLIINISHPCHWYERIKCSPFYVSWHNTSFNINSNEYSFGKCLLQPVSGNKLMGVTWRSQIKTKLKSQKWSKWQYGCLLKQPRHFFRGPIGNENWTFSIRTRIFGWIWRKFQYFGNISRHVHFSNIGEIRGLREYFQNKTSAHNTFLGFQFLRSSKLKQGHNTLDFCWFSGNFVVFPVLLPKRFCQIWQKNGTT